MKILKTLGIVSAIIGIVLAIAVIIVATKPATVSLGDIGTGPYSSETITSSNSDDNQILGGNGVLGSIFIASSSAAAMSFYDGTASTTGTLLFTLPASLAQGDYKLDIAVRKGLIVDGATGFTGQYVITFQ